MVNTEGYSLLDCPSTMGGVLIDPSDDTMLERFLSVGERSEIWENILQRSSENVLQRVENNLESILESVLDRVWENILQRISENVLQRVWENILQSIVNELHSRTDELDQQMLELIADYVVDPKCDDTVLALPGTILERFLSIGERNENWEDIL
jgi:hypothetical protein